MLFKRRQVKVFEFKKLKSKSGHTPCTFFSFFSFSFKFKTSTFFPFDYTQKNYPDHQRAPELKSKSMLVSRGKSCLLADVLPCSTMSYHVSTVFLPCFYHVLPFFTIFYRILSFFTVSYHVFTVFYHVWLCFCHVWSCLPCSSGSEFLHLAPLTQWIKVRYMLMRESESL